LPRPAPEDGKSTSASTCFVPTNTISSSIARRATRNRSSTARRRETSRRDTAIHDTVGDEGSRTRILIF